LRMLLKVAVDEFPPCRETVERSWWLSRSLSRSKSPKGFKIPEANRDRFYLK
jgi:hypothetical protein